LGQDEMTLKKTEKTRTHFNFRIDIWTANGESIVEHVAGIEDYQIALATYRAACERWPSTPITLRQGSRVVEASDHFWCPAMTVPVPVRPASSTSHPRYALRVGGTLHPDAARSTKSI
jgi:hypothetical protein